MISVLAGGDPTCSNGNCPTVYVDDQATKLCCGSRGT
jgi:hypothetical protein